MQIDSKNQIEKLQALLDERDMQFFALNMVNNYMRNTEKSLKYWVILSADYNKKYNNNSKIINKI